MLRILQTFQYHSHCPLGILAFTGGSFVCLIRLLACICFCSGQRKRSSSLTRALSQAYGEHSCLQTIRRNADTVTTLKFAKPREVRARTFYMRTHTERKAVYVMTTRVCSNILQRTYSSIANKKSLHKSYLGLDKDCAERLSTSPRANIPLNPTESPWSIRH